MANENQQEHSCEMRALQRQLLTLYDDLTEFADQCSFLCDAFACIPTQEEVIDDETIRGMSYYAHWMKQRLRKIKTELLSVRNLAESGGG